MKVFSWRKINLWNESYSGYRETYTWASIEGLTPRNYVATRIAWATYRVRDIRGTMINSYLTMKEALVELNEIDPIAYTMAADAVLLIDNYLDDRESIKSIREQLACLLNLRRL